MNKQLFTKQGPILLVIVMVGTILAGAAIRSHLLAPGGDESPPDPVGFISESAIHDDRTVHTFAPDNDTALNYRVSYYVLEDGSPIDDVESRTDPQSATRPLVIEHRNKGATYEAGIRIADEFDRIVEDRRIGVGGDLLPPASDWMDAHNAIARSSMGGQV